MKKLLENPKKKFDILSKLFCYGSIIIAILTLFVYIMNGINQSNIIDYIISGVIYGITTFISGWVLGLIMLWFKSTYKEG